MMVLLRITILLLALVGGASVVAGIYIARLRRRAAELEHLLAGDWQCDACGKWFSHVEPNKGHGCDLCRECAYGVKEQKDG